MIKIIGIDPGTNTTGYGVIELESRRVKLIETGIIQPKKSSTLSCRIHRIYSVLDEILEQFSPDVLVLEKLYSHHSYPATSAILGHVRGVICLLTVQKNVMLVEYSVKRIRKCLVGNGNATKIQTRRVVAQRLNLDEKKLTLDASDALALALGYAQLV